MNLLLLHPADFVAPDRVRIRDHRLAHLREVLAATPGRELRAGLLDGLLGTAMLVHLDTEMAELAVTLDSPPPPPLAVSLILALPRPKILRRVLRAATMLGVKEIHLINSWRVDKSYWRTLLLTPERLRAELLPGLEQALDTALPSLHTHRRFKPFVEDELDAIAGARCRLVAHPRGTEPLTTAHAHRPVVLALGPEGGFIPYEIDSLVACGFTPVTLGPRVLTVDVALAAALGRLSPT
jgi:16S rRNA (uracil1498-N3)-methyltransferase